MLRAKFQKPVKIENDFLTILNVNFAVEVQLGILSLLSIKDLATVAMVSRHYYALIQDKTFWKAFFFNNKEFSFIYEALCKLEQYETFSWYKEYRNAHHYLATTHKTGSLSSESTLNEVLENNLFSIREESLQMLEAIKGCMKIIVHGELEEALGSLNQASFNLLVSQAFKTAFDLSFAPHIFIALLHRYQARSQSQQLSISPDILARLFSRDKRIAAYLLHKGYSLDQALIRKEDNKINVCQMGMLLFSCNEITRKMLIDTVREKAKENPDLQKLISLLCPLKKKNQGLLTWLNKNSDRELLHQFQDLLNEGGNKKQTLLHWLVQLPLENEALLTQYVAFLVRNKFSFESTNDQSKTPLAFAVQQKRFYMVKVFLAQGSPFKLSKSYFEECQQGNYQDNSIYKILVVYREHLSLIKDINFVFKPGMYTMASMLEEGGVKQNPTIKKKIAIIMMVHSVGRDLLLNDLVDAKLLSRAKKELVLHYIIEFMLEMKGLLFDFCFTLTNLVLDGRLDVSDEYHEKLISTLKILAQTSHAATLSNTESAAAMRQRFTEIEEKTCGHVRKL